MNRLTEDRTERLSGTPAPANGNTKQSLESRLATELSLLETSAREKEKEGWGGGLEGGGRSIYGTLAGSG